MHIWHDTPDAPRSPRRVSPTQNVELTIGTWPVGPGQSVWIVWAAIGADGKRADGTVVAQWRHNTDVNSYWTAPLGPFAEADSVIYTVHGSSAADHVQTSPFAIRVRPALYIAWLWHQHQPLYRDPAASTQSGSYRYPWVRLHAIRDYYSMAALAAEHDVHITINLTPVLLREIDHYLCGGATDAALELTRRPAEKLTRAEIEELLSTFFDADWHRQVYVHPRYRELSEQRTSGARFSRQDIRDLQMWFNLAWFGHEFRTGEVRLITGDSVNVHRFVAQQREFSHDDVLAMIDEQYKVLRAIVPILDDFIVAHPMVWTFTHPLATIRHTDQVSIRTNCPGRLTYQIDDKRAEAMNLVAVGGVMAGARRFQVTLGPFPLSAKRLTFRFRCEHPGCDGRAPCCAGEAQEMTFGRGRARVPRRTSAPSSMDSSGGHHADHR